MRRLFAVAAICCIFGSPVRLAALGVYDAERPRATPVVSDALTARLAGTGEVPVWVAFTDKGADADERWAVPGSALSPRAIERRVVRGSGYDATDYPVRADYVAAVTGTGARVRQQSRWFNAVSAWATPGEILRLAQLPFVAEITPVRGRLEDRLPVDAGEIEDGDAGGPDDASTERGESTPEEVAFYGFDPIGYGRSQILDAHRTGYTGAGVLIAVFDSGFYADHPAFRDLNVVDERDFVQGDRNTADDPDRDPPDADSFLGNANMCHGTATWSIAGGYWPGRRVGVAFGADFAVAKTEYPQYERHVEEDNWVAAAEWADSLGADIITSSLGYSTFDTGEGSYTYEDMNGITTIVAQAANLATINGMLVVNSAGNGGPAAQTITSPGDSDSVLTVGAVQCGINTPTCAEEITNFSSRGPVPPAPPSEQERIKPDILAMGQRVPAATSEGCYDPEGGGGFYDDDGDPWADLEDVQGTSFSCPMTAGAAALVLEAHPLWRPYEVRYALKETASDRAMGITPSTTRGWGVIRVADAISIPGFGAALLPLRPGVFDLTGPEPFSENGLPVAEHPPTFTWTESARARTQTPVRYTMQLDDDADFSSPETISDIDALTLTLSTDPEEGFYFWRVVANDATEFTRESRQRPRILIDYPPMPAELQLPAPDAFVDVITPTFTWEASTDESPNETLDYFVTLVSGGRTTEYPFTTELSYTLPADDPARELARHTWWVTTRDRFGVRAVSAQRGFDVGAFPPGAFSVIGPDDDTVSTRRPTLTWNVAVDPNPDDEVSYDVYWGPDAGSMVREVQDLVLPEIRVPNDARFDDGEVVFWQVHARDTFGNETLSDVGTFEVALAPQPFALESPLPDATVYGRNPVFTWVEPLDESEDDSFVYTLAVYADSLTTTLIADQTDITSTSVAFQPALPSDQRMWWRVMATDQQGHSTWSAPQPFFSSPAPLAFAAVSYPNPFTTATGPLTVRYGVPASADGAALRIRVFDGSGRVVKTLASGVARPGANLTVSWDGSADGGRISSPGVYFVSVQVGGEEEVQKIIFLGRPGSAN